MRLSSSTFCVLGDWPSTLTSPVLGELIPASIRSRVDFPAPLGPTRAATLPRGKRNEQSWRPQVRRNLSSRLRHVHFMRSARAPLAPACGSTPLREEAVGRVVC